MAHDLSSTNAVGGSRQHADACRGQNRFYFLEQVVFPRKWLYTVYPASPFPQVIHGAPEDNDSSVTSQATAHTTPFVARVYGLSIH